MGQYCHIHIFLSFLGSLIKQCKLFEIFLQFSLPPPYTMLKLGQNSGYTRPTLFVGWGEGLDLCELENAPEMQVSKDFFHDCGSFSRFRAHYVYYDQIGNYGSRFCTGHSIVLPHNSLCFPFHSHSP